VNHDCNPLGSEYFIAKKKRIMHYISNKEQFGNVQCIRVKLLFFLAQQQNPFTSFGLIGAITFSIAELFSSH